jgi:hypothetical protein
MWIGFGSGANFTVAPDGDGVCRWENGWYRSGATLSVVAVVGILRVLTVQLRHPHPSRQNEEA